MYNLVVFFVPMGALLGLIISLVRRRNAQLGIINNIVVGVMGAGIGAFLVVLSKGYLLLNLNNLLAGAGASIILLLIVPFFESRRAKYLTNPNQELQSSVSPKMQQKGDNQRLPKAAPKTVQSGIIFLSYRRADSADVAGRIYDRLSEAFGKAAVFKDVDSIPLGLDFKEYLDEKVGQCNVLLAVIGDQWLEASDASGRKRLQDPQDFVRIEIESALARSIPVIPLLVRGASMPSEDKLPTGLGKLAYRNGIPIRSDPDFHRDMDRLITALQTAVKAKR